MAKAPLFSRKQSGGMFAIEDQSLSTGDRFYVDSGSSTGSDASGYGENPDSPFLTLDYAVGQTTENNGDIIYVMPGHAETVATASALDFDVAGLKVVGLGWGDTRPIISLSAEASTVEFNANDMWIENIIFQGTFTNGSTVGLDIKTGCDDLYLKNCVIRGTSATKELLIGVTIEATNDRITFDGCLFTEFVGTASAAILTEGAFTNLRIMNCEFAGTWSDSILDLDDTASTLQGVLVENCTLVSHGASDGAMIKIDNTTVAQFLYVETYGIESNQLPLDAGDDGATLAIECYGTDAAGTHGLIWPTLASAW